MRNHEGLFNLAYFEFYGSTTSMVAETRALLRGLQLSVPTFQFIHVEIDSLELVHILRDGHSCPWNIYYYVKTIKDLLSSICWVISHVFRKGNEVADCLANEAVESGCSRVFTNCRQLSKAAQGALLINKAGLAKVRN